MRGEAKVWLEQAEENFKTAQAMWKAHRYGFTCFCCQQTLEVILKAAFIAAGKDYPKIHSLAKLFQDSELPKGDVNLEILKEISKHYFQVRYPDLLRGKYNRALAYETLEKTRRIYSWIKNQIIKK